jgi:hypothetical protein
MSKAKTFYQSHECEGYRAKITIEWEFPHEIEPAWRSLEAEEIADAILRYSGPKMRDMVQVMRGYRTPPR